MAFLGYYAKIDTTFTLTKQHYTGGFGLFKAQVKQIDEYTDANNVYHEAVHSRKRYIAAWTTPIMREDTARALLVALNEGTPISVSYYDFVSDSYKTGTFKAIVGDIISQKHTDTDIRLVAPFSVRLEEF